MQSEFDPIDEVIADFKAGKMVVMVDDSNRENEGDLTVAAEKITPEMINFMITHGRGLVCLALAPEIADRLHLPLQTTANTSSFGTGFTVTIDAKDGTTSGVSAQDRATTILKTVSDDCAPEDLARPGHIFPLRAREGGCLVRAGQTEGSVDLAGLAGLKSAAVICEVMNPDGSMARVPELQEFCKEHDIKMCSVEDIIRYRTKHERVIERKVAFRLPTEWGVFNCFGYTSKVDSEMHIALCVGDIGPQENGEMPLHEEAVLVRVHSECLTGDALGSLRCDCRSQLHQSLQMVAEAGKGVVLYMRQEGRGIGLEGKLHAYALQDKGEDTVEANESLGYKADERDYGVGSQILYDLGLRKLDLLTNNPRKYRALSAYGLNINERVSIVIEPNPENERYLDTKKSKLGHIL
jgi:3,4-dihydroxy 2-butanone 4-phosphate synthase / GTP cyclohydrolase II